MPVVKHGFAFKYFDKIICGVAALALLASLLFAMVRVTSASRLADPQAVQPELDRLERALRERHVETETRDYVAPLRRQLTDVAEPEPLPTDNFYMPLPVRYPPLAISSNRTFVLEFGAPLNVEEIKVSGGLIRLLEHPVEGDYRRVRLSSGPDSGEVVVEARSSDGARHVYPVVVDPSAGKTAFPPSSLEIVSTRDSAVVLNVVPNPLNEQEGVTVAQYEIWRRDWEDPLGAFRKVASVEAEEVSSAAPGALPYPVPTQPGVPGALTGVQEEVPTGIYWQDSGVTPGQRYGYKVRMVGANTYPAASEFTDAVLAEVEPLVDFRFASSVGERVRCEVLQSAGAGQATIGTFNVAPGEEIGGVQTAQIHGSVTSYLTGNVLLDFHRGVLLQGGITTDRLVYADAEGFVRQRLRRETKIGQEKWDEAAAAARSRAGSVGGRGRTGLFGR
ncbi:MAG: hypothetical protein GXY85_01235 [Candidatus Brocadiaceae bacterium]|nr:hypothetical protein [Candidatus Brocadiaceae bacterium]